MNPTHRQEIPCAIRGRRPLAGFSLVEVLIALAIFAAASTVLVSAFASAMLARDRSEGNDLLHTDIRAVRMQLLLEPSLEAAEDGGDYPTLNHGEANWQAAIEPTEIVDLFKVELQIEFSDPPEGQIASYSEQLYLLRPTWSEAGDRSELLEDKRAALEDSRDFR
jgi:general secretion pathway protein I